MKNWESNTGRGKQNSRPESRREYMGKMSQKLKAEK